MGGLFSINMEAAYKKNQAFIEELSRTALERQMQAQNQMIERQKAIAISSSRDTFHWLAAFYTVVGTGLLTGFKKTKKPGFLAPFVPLTFLGAYYWDLAYGTKLDRITLGAEEVLIEEHQRLGLPGGLPTPEAIEKCLRPALERQMQAQNQMIERQKAIAISSSRDTFHWLAAFYTVVGTGLLTGFKKTKKPGFLAPFVPLTFLGAYYWDLAYGTKLDRITLGAEEVLIEEHQRLGLPGGLPTPEAIEKCLRPAVKTE